MLPAFRILMFIFIQALVFAKENKGVAPRLYLCHIKELDGLNSNGSDEIIGKFAEIS
tara:strand:+ start:200 stop:370 length:171 start_codon:yes stop_codon:yes gene_type:complete